MRRVRNDDSGAVAVLVAGLTVFLLFFAAIAIDLSALYAERRELQNGSDAGSLAIAASCAKTACPTPAQARIDAVAFADANANDGASGVQTVCSNEPTLYDGVNVTLCDFSATNPDLHAKLTALDTAGVRYVAVTDMTERQDGSSVMPPIVSGVFGNTGKAITATSIAAWGSSSSGGGSSIPLIISACEWEIWTQEGKSYATPEPPYAGVDVMPWSFQTEIKTHDPLGSTPEACRTGGGFNSQLPGGFGWLVTAGKTLENCYATSDPDGTVDSKQGVLPCADLVLEEALVSGVPVRIPIFTDPPAGKEYTITGDAWFFITGYYVSGMGKLGRHLLLDKALKELPDPPPANVPACIATPNEDCVTGFFLEGDASDSAIPTAPSFGGTTVFSLVG